ncbi:hypothetical protein JCGZ_17450 [Jatropha curcas]|uniref:Uncharacterized protein n=1 Tax=Jatropha curcas TaxID=180498 RepID=A0A067LD05_JATCU|nr:hypothetical protein JCGZ_17450 [Jatropha curcas]
MEKAPAPGVGNANGASNSTKKLMPTPPNVSTLDLQIVALLTQAYNDLAAVLQRIMAKPVVHIPPEGGRHINIATEGGDANKTMGDDMGDEDSS